MNDDKLTSNNAQDTVVPSTAEGDVGPNSFGDDKGADEEETFIHHRVFVNQVDGYLGRHIALILTDKNFREHAGDIGEEMLDETEESPTAPLDLGVTYRGYQMKYEVIGVARNPFYKKTEDVKLLLANMCNTSEDTFMKEVMKCGFIVYDITNDPDEIPKAQATLAAIEKQLEEAKEEEPKNFQRNPEQRVFVLISTIMTWAKTRPIDRDDPDVAFVETDFRKRRPHPNYKAHIDLEKEVMQKGKKFPEKLMTIVIAAGIMYGSEEEDLHFLFKLAWQNEPQLPLISPGNNQIPLIHIVDVVSILFGVFENVPRKPKYILAVEQITCSHKQIVKAIAKLLGTNRVKFITQEEAFLYPQLTQEVYERLTVNLKMEPNYIVNDLAIEWKSESNLAENMKKIVEEFREARKLSPVKIIIHGPPAVGKTEVAKKLAEHYKIHYISVKSLIDDTLAELRKNIEYGNYLMQLQKEKEAIAEDADDEDEAEEEEEEDMVSKVEDWKDKLKNIERRLDESTSGKLSDMVISELLKEKLNSNACQNQGYILDGYPKTMAQTKEIFSIFAGEEEGEMEAEEDEEGIPTNSLLPHFVISLEASDDYLCNRVMQKPENEIFGTHYTEEHMVRRLAEFHENNTELNTLLDVFDEIEIHPFLINAETDDIDQIMTLIYNHIGPFKGYPLSDHELDLQRLADEQIKIKEIEEAVRLRKELEQKTQAEHEKNMERWADLLQTVQHEEEQMLTAECKPLREYLVRFIFPTLTRGLLETARVKPNDPIDFLAEYLFKENPEGRMFDPAFVSQADELFKSIEDFQEKLGL